MEARNTKTKVFNGIDEELHRTIKIEAAKLSMTINDYIKKLFDERK
jgi:predicted HicB family RNase H-like nuclease